MTKSTVVFKSIFLHALVLSVLLAATTARGTVINVPGDYPTIAQAVNAASNGDEIVVANGTYTGNNNKNIELTKQILVRSANGPANCTIDCEGVGRAFWVHGSTHIGDTEIRGFSIRSGYRTDGGSAILIRSPVTVRNCDIGDCQAPGGDLTWQHWGTVQCSDNCVIADCVISSNSATFGGGLSIGDDFEMVEVEVRDTVISSNEAGGHGGGVYNLQGSIITFTRCVIDDNIAGVAPLDVFVGGGLFLSNGSDVAMANCVITNNQVANNQESEFAYGAGIFALGNCTIRVANGLIAGNNVAPPGKAGGVANWGCTMVFSDCTIAMNDGDEAGGAYYDMDRTTDSIATFNNCVVWGNVADAGAQFQLDDPDSSVDITYCDVQGGSGAIGGETPNTYANNINADPKFAGTGNYHLLGTSPCRNRGNSSLLPADELDLDGDNNTTEPIPYDLDAPNARVHPTGCKVDMGCYEIKHFCPGDVTGGGDSPPDGMVDINDLLAVILEWGTASLYADLGPLPSHPCGDGTVNIDDLLAVITNWGPCEGFTGDPGSIDSVEDCIDVASEGYEEGTQEWEDSISRCVAGLCAAQIISCD